MRTIGMIATGIAAVIAVVGVALGVRSIPEAKRYLDIRSM
jgi:hypothetical protein